MTAQLSAKDARRRRWTSQLLGGSDLGPAGVVDRAIALQGQDLPAVLRAIAIRSRPGTTVDDVRAAFNAGELVRSWPMRGTLFATTPTHLAELLAHTAPRILKSNGRRRTQLEIDDAAIERAWDALGGALAERPLRRADVMEIWEAAGLAPTGGRGYHLLAHLAIAGRVHWGPFSDDGAEQLLTATSPGSRAVSEASTSPGPRKVTSASSAGDVAPDRAAESLPAVVRGFVAARGPVTEADLAWWCKLPKSVLRAAIGECSELVEVEVEGAPAWLVDDAAAVGGGEPSAGQVTLVPAFDEWILGYADRSLVASPSMLDALVPGRNGVFRPAVLVDGVVVGTWRVPPKSAKGDRAVEVELVEKVSATKRRAIDEAAAAWPHA